MFLCGENERREANNANVKPRSRKKFTVEEHLEDLRWEKKQREELEKAPGVKKLERKISCIGRRGVRPDTTLYLSTVAWEGQEGRAFCPQSRCRGSSYWGWVSLIWRTFQTHREDRRSLSDRQSGIFVFF